MYQGNSKDTGAIVGRIGGNGSSVDLTDAQEMVGAEESLIGFDEDGNEVVISAALNPANGEVIWQPSYNLEESKNKTVAMSQMTSMLRDHDRNHLFEQAIQIAIQAFIEKNQRKPIVLDIGCGTGLLSLFAARHGAEYVFAVEMFDTMATIATEVIAANHFSDKIFVVNAKSTDIDQLPCEVDIIISELLDSALLGESCLPSHADAIKRFLRKDEAMIHTINNPYALSDRIIPNRGEVYATLVEGAEIRSMVRVDGVVAGREPFVAYRNEYARQCHGGWPMIPVHWEALQHRGAKKLSDSVPCLQVSFADTHHNIYFNMMTQPELRTSSHHYSQHPQQHPTPQSPQKLVASNHPIKSYDTEIHVKEEGTIHGILFWWKAYLLSQSINPINHLFYSTEPGIQNWQDHWQQMIYPLPEPIQVHHGDVIQLHVSHDDLSFWVNVVKAISSTSSSSLVSLQNTSRTVGLKRNREENTVKILQNMIPRYYEEGIDQKYSCICGWHLLHGCYQLLHYNYFPFNKLWDNLLDYYLDFILQYSLSQQTDHHQHQHHHQQQQQQQQQQQEEEKQQYSSHRLPSPTIILDTSDGSILSITFAIKLRNKILALRQQQQLQIQQSSPSNDNSVLSLINPIISNQQDPSYSTQLIQFITKERKQFSGIFYSQLIHANELEGMITEWDGNIEDLPSLLEGISEGMNHSSNENDDELMNEMTDDAVESPKAIHDINHPDLQTIEVPKIPFLIHNCFSYQLQSLPVWEAISFYYQRISLHPFLEPQAIILPGKAVLMALPLELPDLKNCHGLVHSVSGFDHTPLDRRQSQWHQYIYPYRLANYRKKALSVPTPIAVLDYKQCSLDSIHQITDIPFITLGNCDAVAIWVDYHLSNVSDPSFVASLPSAATAAVSPNGSTSIVISPFQQNDFLPFMTQSVKFIEQGIAVNPSHRLRIECYFEFGLSDFQYHFEIIS